MPMLPRQSRFGGCRSVSQIIHALFFFGWFVPRPIQEGRCCMGCIQRELHAIISIQSYFHLFPIKNGPAFGTWVPYRSSMQRSDGTPALSLYWSSNLRIQSLQNPQWRTFSFPSGGNHRMGRHLSAWEAVWQSIFVPRFGTNEACPQRFRFIRMENPTNLPDFTWLRL